MKFVVWGAGQRGTRIFEFLGQKRVVAIIESNQEYVGKDYMGTPIIDFSQYKESYLRYFIIVTPLRSEDIINCLRDEGIYNYFLLSDCPSEMQFSGHLNLLQDLPIRYTVNNRIGIYGINLFSVLLYQYLKRVGCKNIYLLPQYQIDIKFYEEIRKRFPDIIMKDLESIQGMIDKLWVTVEKNYEELLKEGRDQYDVENCYDFSDRFSEYFNPAIEKFKDIYIGKRCFIVATGPSLTMQDLDCLHEHGEICISMNRISCAFSQTKWRPDYYVVQDPIFIKEFGYEISQFSSKGIFFSDYYPEFWDANPYTDICKYHCCWEVFFPHLPKFSENFAQKVYEGYTVTYTCIQLAVYMGFTEIILLGVDASYTLNVRDVENHFSKDYFTSKSDVGKPAYIEENQMAYYKAEEYAKNKGIKIYNATRGGYVEAFERVDFNSLFCKET